MKKLVPFFVSAVVALFLGFGAFSPDEALAGFDAIAYYWIAGAFFAGVALGLWHSRESLSSFFKTRWKRWEHLGAAFVIALVSGYCIASEPWGFRVVMDEPVLVATAGSLTEHHRPFLPLRGYEVQGHYWAVDKMLGITHPSSIDKRPLLFPFLVSLLHTYKGFSWTQGNLLNNLLCPVFFLALYVFLRGFLGFWACCAALFFVAALPLMPWVVNGAGMEVLMLLGFVLLCMASRAFLNNPIPGRLSVLCLTTFLVAQTRYEMAVFVVPTALIILLAWWKAKTLITSWGFVLTPLLFVPSVWQQKLLGRDPSDYQVTDAVNLGFVTQDHGVFSIHYLWNNLKYTAGFFFNLDGRSPNNALLSAFGLVGLIALGVYVVRSRRPFVERSGTLQASALLGLGVFLAFMVFLAYAWGNMHQPITCRFSLLFSVVGLMAFAGFLDHKKVHRLYLQGACVLTPLMALGLSSQLKGHYYYNKPSFHQKAMRFLLERTQALSQDPLNAGALYLSEMTYLTASEHYNSLNTGRATKEKARLAAFMERNPQKPIYVFQIAQYSSVQKNWDYLVDLQAHGFHLKPIEAIIVPGAPPLRMLQLSRLEYIDLSYPESILSSSLPTNSDLATQLALLP